MCSTIYVRQIPVLDLNLSGPSYGTVSAKIAPRLKCYKNASRLNRYNFPTDNAIDFLFSTLHSVEKGHGITRDNSTPADSLIAGRDRGNLRH